MGFVEPPLSQMEVAETTPKWLVRLPSLFFFFSFAVWGSMTMGQLAHPQIWQVPKIVVEPLLAIQG
jgi:hypothetical protein